MNTIVECVPNFSDGRRPEVLAAIVEAIASDPAVAVLDASQDADHNRAVVTFVAPLEHVGDAAFRAAKVAVEMIDLREHSGRHPRIGAVDVLPFIPIRNVTMDQCAALARETARRLADELGVPTYLYEHAAQHDHRHNLAQVRRGGFEGLAERMDDPAHRPDFGPASPHPSAGATAVGARKVLLAYNINLDTDDVGVAKKIAATIRESSGGLPSVKALGVMLDERRVAQVSMNLVDHERTPLHVVFDRVDALAREHGVGILESELIGLIPQAVLDETANARLGIAAFSPHRILENRIIDVLEKARLAESESIVGGAKVFLDRVAEAVPMPAGGCVAGMQIAMGAGLGLKVARIANRKRRDGSADLDTAIDALTDLERRARASVDADADAYNLVITTRRRAKAEGASPSELAAKTAEALIVATRVPVEIASLGVDVMKRLATLRTWVKPPTDADLTAALAAARSGAQTCLILARANLRALPGGPEAAAWREAINGLEAALKADPQ